MSLRDAAIEAVLDLEHRSESAPLVPTVNEYVDTVLGVVAGRLESVVRELHAQGDLTPAGARTVHRVLDAAEVTA